ncbi:hypothetical protein DP163_gp130 [Sea otter poxvirus]|uniref:Uncharacterized protein n=1 Tax=Sea otter poxvirus TaxID=1416741 RepID=A0A2U9QHU8_9POXV|nr:hypothetical protein DP163_gp130 [Sea otter poxvirus]AWU47175.1 hypothetical protein [Sea otter poxvirus]
MTFIHENDIHNTDKISEQSQYDTMDVVEYGVIFPELYNKLDTDANDSIDDNNKPAAKANIHENIDNYNETEDENTNVKCSGIKKLNDNEYIVAIDICSNDGTTNQTSSINGLVLYFAVTINGKN